MPRDWTKEQSVTAQAISNVHKSEREKKEEQAKLEAKLQRSAIENENNYVQDSLSQLRAMILHLRQWELNGHDNHYRADIIEMIRTCEGQLERYSTQMKKYLKHLGED